MYIYQREEWPRFFWDEQSVVRELIQVKHMQGQLMGMMKALGFHHAEETILQTLTQDVLKTSEIEGEILDQDQVRSSVARHLGIDIAAVAKVDKSVDGVVEMMLDATRSYEQKLTEHRLFQWHSLLFPNNHYSQVRVGAWRKGKVDVISGQLGKEIVHFEAPDASRVELEIELFLNWVNGSQEMDSVLKAAIAHLWFVTIHPFDDGNGRIARAIADMLLAQSEKSSNRYYSLSAQIQTERRYYYNLLEQTQKGSLDITRWIVWFLQCLLRAIDKAHHKLDTTIQKAKIWDSINQYHLNERQKKILNRMLDGFEGKLNTSKWAKITKCSQDTAYRDILDLMEKGILIKNPEGGRSTSYSLNTLHPSPKINLLSR